jgi:hypothetical protein
MNGVREQECRLKPRELGIGERNVALHRGDRDRKRLTIEIADRDRRAQDRRDVPTDVLNGQTQ